MSVSPRGPLLGVGPSPAHLVAHNDSILGVVPSGYDRPFKEGAQAFLLEHWRAGRLRLAVHEAVPFERIPDAVEVVARGGVMGKLVVRLGASIPSAAESSTV